MNRNLFLFSLFIVILSIAFNFYLLTLFGGFMLIMSLITNSRGPQRPAKGTPVSEAPRRIAPRQKAPPAAAPSEPSSVSVTTARIPSSPETTAPSMTSTYQSYSPALFPNSMFPSLSLSGVSPQQTPEAQPKKETTTDGLLETGAMLALLRMLLG